MRNHLQYRRNDAEKRCAICDGKFGLIRHYSWRTALCSKGCVDRFKSREEADRRSVTPSSSHPTSSCSRNYRISKQGGYAMSFPSFSFALGGAI
jgi:hypothetical protein